MTSASSCVLTINSGSSSIRFSVYEAGETPRRRLDGKIDRIGLSDMNLIVNDPAKEPRAPRRLNATDHRTAVGFLLDWLEAHPVFASINAAGHRVVHGLKHSERSGSRRSCSRNCTGSRRMPLITCRARSG